MSISRRFVKSLASAQPQWAFYDSFSTMIIRQGLERQAKTGMPFAMFVCVCVSACVCVCVYTCYGRLVGSLWGPSFFVMVPIRHQHLICLPYILSISSSGGRKQRPTRCLSAYVHSHLHLFFLPVFISF